MASLCHYSVADVITLLVSWLSNEREMVSGSQGASLKARLLSLCLSFSQSVSLFSLGFLPTVDSALIGAVLAAMVAKCNFPPAS